MEATNYPLAWPVGWKRTPTYSRRSAIFGRSERLGDNAWSTKRRLTVSEAIGRILAELSRMGIDSSKVIISTNVRVRLDGLPRSGEREPTDPGAAVYWTSRQGPRVMAIDQYTRVADNLAAIAATLDAMRAIERHGGAVILERAFTGFSALPAPVAAGKPWRQVLGFELDETPTEAQVREEYRIARGDAHPDRPTGSHEEFLAVQSAFEAAARELGFTP